MKNNNIRIILFFILLLVLSVTNAQNDPIGELANKSVNEFNDLIKVMCNDTLKPHSIERKNCMKKAANHWLKTYSQRYSSIPSSYITGNDIAQMILER